MKQDEKHRIDMIVKIMHWILIIFAVCFLLMIIPAKCSAQQIQEPNYGLAITGTGMSICAIGTTMRTSVHRQYTSRYGYNYVSYENYSTTTLRLSTLAVGIVVTIGGILIQNRRKKKNS